MNTNYQHPFGLDEPGRVIVESETYRAPISGRTIEIIGIVETIYDQGIFRTGKKKLPEVLDDGRSVTSTDPIRECARCLALVHVDNSYVCRCGRTFCSSCKDIDSGSCIDCAMDAKTPAVVRMIKKLVWG
jgi:hypothetical protein